MKKLISLMLCLCMLLTCMCTTAMATETAPTTDAAAVAGQWISVGGEADGMTLDKDMLAMFGMSVELKLNTDATATLTMEGEEEGGIAWTADAAGVTLTVEGDSLVLPFNENGGLTWDLGGGTLLHFEKAVVGKWIAVGAESEGVALDKDMLSAFGLTVELVVNEDGTASLSMEGEVQEGLSWTADAAGIILTADGESLPVIFNDKGGVTMDFGGVYLFLELEDAEEGEAAPVGEPVDLSASAIIGTWFDGDTTNFTINEDGTCVATDQYGDSYMEWEVVDGVPTITTGFWCDSPMILNEDGTLYVSDGWSVDKTFTFGAGEIRVGSTLADPTGTVAAASADAFFGEWIGDTMVMESGTFKLADMMMVMNLTINADGTMALFDGAATDSTAWTFVDGALTAEDGMITLSLMEDGSLCMAQEFNILYLVRAGSVMAGIPVDVPAAPVENSVDLTGNPAIGVWNDGEGTTFTVNADGTCVATDEWGDSMMEWTIVDGVAKITSGMWSDAPMVPQADGTLYVNDGFFIDKYLMPGAYEKPVVDLTGNPVIGVWNDGNGTTFTVNADGSCVATDVWGDNAMEWNVVDGVPTITGGLWYGAPMVLNADGTLYVNDGWVIDATFAPGAAESQAPAGAAGAVAGTAEDFVGVWNASVMDLGGMTMNAADLGMVMDLTINADGTITMFDGESTETGTWTLVDGKVDVMGEMTLEMTEDGRMALAEDGATMFFVRAEGGVSEPTAPMAEVFAVPGEMEDFAGMWFGASIEMEGMTMALSDIGMTMEINMMADGTITLFDGETTENGVWTLVDGKADIDGMICTLMSDGTMVAEDPEGAKVIFTGFIGEWKACYMSTGGLTGDLRSMGITSTLILNADGTGSVDFPAAEEGIWYNEDGVLRFGEAGMPIELLSGGFLKFGSDMAGYVVYSRDENAVWDPNAAPAATAVPEPIVDPTAIPTQGSAGGEIDMNARMGVKYVAKTYSAFGQTMDASVLGAEYSVLFRENGTCDFGIAGMVVPNLPWGLQKVAVGLNEMDAFVINYYGTMFNVVPTAEGFDMDYYGTMTLHLVAAE